MTTTKTIRVPALLLVAASLVLAATDGCAHRRQAYYPADVASPNPGVHVRAPFVDVQVRGKPRRERDEMSARRDVERDEDEDDRDRD